VIDAVPVGGFSKYHASARTTTLVRSFWAAINVSELEPYIILTTGGRGGGAGSLPNSETPTIKIPFVPPPIVCGHVKVTKQLVHELLAAASNAITVEP
jgi:hypothetical protein